MHAEEPEPIEIRAPLDALVAGLTRPGALVPGETAEVVETHVSVVFLAGDRAWKVKKPVRLWGLVDYGTVARRRHFCEEEVRLNRRFAPGIYRGVVPVTRTGETFAIDGAGAVVEHAVEMARLPVGATLRERLERGVLAPDDVAALGCALAAFHAAERLSGEAAKNALPARFANVLRRNFGDSTAAVPTTFPERVHEGLRARLIRRLAFARRLIRTRVEAGRVVDGHGDIRLEHAVLLDGRPGLIDCCEFDARLRHVDPLSDAAFPSMDLALHGRADLAAAFERAYLDATGDPDGAALLPLYRAYRAHVRAMVDARSCRAPGVAEAVRRRKALGACRGLALAWSEARTGAVPPVVVMRGAAGTGKSVLAAALAPWLRGTPISSDVVRKEMLGMAPTARPDAAARRFVYGSPMHARTYAALLERGRAAVLSGRAALLDATYLLRATRLEARAMARSLGAPFAVLDVQCPPEVVRSRLEVRARRDDDASDADWAVYEAQTAEAEPCDGEEAAFVATFASGRPAEEAVMPLLDVLERQVDARRERLGEGA